MESSMKHKRTIIEKEKEMTIDVKVTKTITITVQESDSIGHVKSLIHDHEGIPECLQQLFSKDVRLTDDEQKLMDCGIIENSTLHAYIYIDNSVPKVLLVKRPHTNVTITVYSRTFNTIQDVKCRIGVKEGVNSKKFSLIHDGKFLDDDKTLVFYKINGGSTLHMVYIPRDKLLISTKETVKIEVKVALTVRDIKTIIESRVGYSISFMDLFIGKHKLEDSKILYHSDVNEESVLKVKSKTIQILIKTSGGSITLDVQRHELVKDVKGMLLQKLNIPVHLQKLVFEGKSLANYRDLASYNIRMHSNIIFDFRSPVSTTTT
ncbi:polyubiquitin-like [Solanum pennellii]|uniref:Polyubiquitin-like n=1 Tax=Solanum pennellii TaxID=28526 RepID=A0ABM1FQ99_SOLPN|nr:polyubiquitin-like [Solanum pennellii]